MSWNVLPERSPNRLKASQCFMTEYRGDIYLVYTHGLEEKQTFLKLDLANRRWTEKIRLGLTFYLGVQSAVTSTTNRDLVETPRLNFWTECNVWIKPPMNVSDLFKS
ncbi:unnamed protein product [Microthlaspi erraticum]|uniref:Uncharacterized protein n=1 Tax=Microthlaspi erraticum TaxID=1685480 RepID=A0A6D2KQZ4_9BRAS|nr:unnamed protein product [Microthlaspi erraticum]